MSTPTTKAPQALRIQELPERDRSRERLQRLGPEAPSPPELLALVIDTGGAGRSALMVTHKKFLGRADGSWRRLAEQPAGQLAQLAGVGAARATAIVAALEQGRRLMTERRELGAPLRAPSDVVSAYAPRLEDLAVEEFHVAALDVHHRLECDILVTRGLLNTSLVHPREVFRAAVAERPAWCWCTTIRRAIWRRRPRIVS